MKWHAINEMLHSERTLRIYFRTEKQFDSYSIRHCNHPLNVNAFLIYSYTKKKKHQAENKSYENIQFSTKQHSTQLITHIHGACILIELCGTAQREEGNRNKNLLSVHFRLCRLLCFMYCLPKIETISVSVRVQQRSRGK